MSLEENLKEGMDALADQPTEVKAAVGSAIAQAAIPSPPGRVVGALWILLVATLSTILLGALGGIIYILINPKTGRSTDVIVTIFTAALTGLLGLFVKTPSSSQ